jgi:hypothetical protein
MVLRDSPVAWVYYGSAACEVCSFTLHLTDCRQKGWMPPGPRNNQSLEQMSSHPSPLPGNDTNTGNLSFIPTFADDKKGDDKRLKDNKKDDTRKSS